MAVGWSVVRAVALALLVSVPVGIGQDVAQSVEFIVGFDKLPTGLEAGEVLAGATVVHVTGSLRMVLVETDAPASFLAEAGRRADVRYIEPNLVAYQATVVPNDPRWDDQYGPQQVRAPEAWDSTIGGSRTICVADTGIRDTHEDLAGARWLGGWNFVANSNDPWDDNGHGTHVSGIAAASMDNGVGIAGVAQVGLLAAKVLDGQGSGTFYNVASGIAWCADNGDIINLSLGSPYPSSSTADAVRYATNQGALVVAAAGNAGPCGYCVGYPAALDEAIAVTCTDSNRDLCSFSSTGPESELAAPGKGILSTYRRSDTDYVSLSGTSMSTPHVAGVAALVWGHAPSLTNDELRALLRDTAVDLGSVGPDHSFGSGLVDAAAALAALAGPGAPGNLAATPGEESIGLSWQGPSGDVSSYRIYRGADATALSFIASTNLEQYTNRNLSPGDTYWYQVTAVNELGESEGSNVATATVAYPPEAAFSFSPEFPTVNQEVAFTDQSTDQDDDIAAWHWDFDDGETSDQRSSTHAFGASGTYHVTLRVTDSTGIEDAVSHQVTVNQPPTAAFDFSPADPTTQDSVSFTDHSSDDGHVAAWEWDLGDGTTSTDQHPLHRYVDDGAYQVSLTVTDDLGATDSATATVQVANVAPAANFTFTPAAPTTADTVSFEDASTDADGTIEAWEWDFGDGTTSTVAAPSHRYQDDGSYQVTLTVSDDDGAQDWLTRTILVSNLAPSASFSHAPMDPSTADLVTFTDSSTDPDGDITGWSWDFGDGEGSPDHHPAHQYADDGTYTVTLTVTDDDGASSQATAMVVVSNVAPTADFAASPQEPTTQDEVSFTDQSSDSDGTIVAWDWDFGDGSTSTDQHPTHTYDDGTYTVRLVVSDDDGATAEATLNLVVANVGPTAAFSFAPSQPSTQDDVAFSDGSSDVDGSLTQWSWSFGDGHTSTQQSPTHRYADDGTYNVTLTVTDDDGAQATISHSVTVTNAVPEASFGHDPVEPRSGESVQFTDTSIDLDGQVASWAWDFGDGSTSSDQHPTHWFANTQTYTVSLTVTDDDGAQATASTEVRVVDPPSEPRELTATSGPGLGEIRLRWTRPADHGGAPILGNIIYRSDGGGFEAIAEVGNVVKFTDRSRQLGQLYTYYVVPYNRAGTGPASNEATAAGTGL